MTDILKTALYDRHVALGAKMVPFAGYSMPVSYTGIQVEHFAVRRDAGIFDASHMGVVHVHGPDALAFIQSIATNDASKLVIGSCQYSALCYPNGTCVDDIFVSRVGEYEYHIVVNASNKAKDLAWMKNHQGAFRVALDMLNVGVLALQGPNAPKILIDLLGTQISNLPRNGCAIVNWLGARFLVSRTGYTGEDGFELFPPVSLLENVWDTLTQAGALPCGLGCRDTLRLESGFSLYGHEINDTIHLVEAGLSWIIAWDKPSFVGKEALLEYRTQGAKRKLVGLLALDRALPRDGQEVVNAQGEVVGHVTSGGLSPVMNKGIAMALVNTTEAVTGSQLGVRIRDQIKPFQVTSRRFHQMG